MHHHHVASFVAIWVSIFAGMAGAAFAIVAGVWEARRPGPRGFDFAASARRIRTAPIRARTDA